ncbi:MAG: thiamine pyrophosphate-dependent dehydrogenase E1 component subunit alpha [Trueperaceae bacterium]|nr:thiamine pyrophosphate-dependent dehydrogenase E1 component subunit alpha [Trueperaceae bacterium]
MSTARTIPPAPNGAAAGETPPPDALLAMYTTMLTMRRFDERVRDLSAAKAIPGYAHTYFGSEAIAAGVMAALRPDDWIASTYRCHGHAIAKGVALEAMAGELYGRTTGTAKGKGGSMHVSDFDVGMLGAFGIVAAGIPIALGAALTAMRKGTGQVAVAFFGDGAVHQGVFHEGAGLAMLWNAPVVLLCENNQYAEATAIEYHLNTSTIADMACAYAMPAERADGMDVVSAYAAARRAVERARTGGGPTLLELVSYRFSGQYEGDAQGYQPPEEIARWRERDPITTFERLAPERGISTEALARVADEVDRAVDAAFAAAERAPFPEPDDLFDDVYVSYP